MQDAVKDLTHTLEEAASESGAVTGLVESISKAMNEVCIGIFLDIQGNVGYVGLCVGMLGYVGYVGLCVGMLGYVWVQWRCWVT